MSFLWPKWGKTFLPQTQATRSCDWKDVRCVDCRLWCTWHPSKPFPAFLPVLGSGKHKALAFPGFLQTKAQMFVGFTKLACPCGYEQCRGGELGRGSVLAQWVRALAARANDLSLISGIHVIEGENWLSRDVHWPPHDYLGMRKHPQVSRKRKKGRVYQKDMLLKRAVTPRHPSSFSVFLGVMKDASFAMCSHYNALFFLQ